MMGSFMMGYFMQDLEWACSIKKGTVNTFTWSHRRCCMLCTNRYVFRIVMSVMTSYRYVFLEHLVRYIFRPDYFLYVGRFLGHIMVYLGVCLIFLRLDRSINKIHKPRAFISIEVFYKKYVFVYYWYFFLFHRFYVKSVNFFKNAYLWEI